LKIIQINFRYKGFNIGETTPPPESQPYGQPDVDDGFPKVFNMTTNSFTVGGIAAKKVFEEK